MGQDRRMAVRCILGGLLRASLLRASLLRAPTRDTDETESPSFEVSRSAGSGVIATIVSVHIDGKVARNAQDGSPHCGGTRSCSWSFGRVDVITGRRLPTLQSHGYG